MKIAITSENGLVFDHFGKSTQFTMFDTENELIREKCIVSTDGKQHGDLADFLKENAVDVVICGGMGGGAKNALRERRIEIVSGVSGNVDEIIVKYLSGENIQSFDSECNHTHDCHCNDHKDSAQ